MKMQGGEIQLHGEGLTFNMIQCAHTLSLKGRCLNTGDLVQKNIWRCSRIKMLAEFRSLFGSWYEYSCISCSGGNDRFQGSRRTIGRLRGILNVCIEELV
jgi:hypothetical protein